MIYDQPPPIWLPPKPAIIRPDNRIKKANFLPGMFPAGAASGAAGLSSISVADSTVDQTLSSTVTAPSDIIAGDLIVLWNLSENTAGAVSSVIPSGFTEIATSSQSQQRCTSSYKLADGSEASASLTVMDGDSRRYKAIYVFRGDVPATSVTLSSSVGSQSTSGNPSSQSVIASGGTPPLVVLGFYGAFSTIDPRTFSPSSDGEIGSSDSRMFIDYKIYNESPADVTIDMDDEGASNHLHSCYIEMAA